MQKMSDMARDLRADVAAVSSGPAILAAAKLPALADRLAGLVVEMAERVETMERGGLGRERG